ncbi:unnamed protein product [Boreogadus saida]
MESSGGCEKWHPADRENTVVSVSKRGDGSATAFVYCRRVFFLFFISHHHHHHYRRHPPTHTHTHTHRTRRAHQVLLGYGGAVAMETDGAQHCCRTTLGIWMCLYFGEQEVEEEEKKKKNEQLPAFETVEAI